MSYQYASSLWLWYGVLTDVASYHMFDFQDFDRNTASFMFEVKILTLAFIGQAQQRETCIVSLLKALSTFRCAGLHWLIWAIKMKILV